ncbi:hypothetical protein MKX08_002562 [Trichoderma sp. CBMAI-0020]|nr:hypothetical protein MKX08_002562 [Trichoderma sp. CBMAI-0020]
MTDHIAEEGGGSVEATVEFPQGVPEEHTEWEQVPEVPIEGQQANFGLLCAAYIPEGQCLNTATIPCQICQLVAYCTEECMKKDAERHTCECPLPIEPPSRSEPTSEIPDDPVQDRGFFWANYAATDVLNLAANEGLEYDGILRILLTGTFGLRHLIYSVVAMPETASPRLEITISEMELPHLFRTFLSLLILRRGDELNMGPYEVADLVLHLGCTLLSWRALKIYLNESIKQELIKQELINQEPIDQEPINQEPINQEPINQEPINQEPINQEPINQEPINQEPNQEPTDQEPIDQASIDQAFIDQSFIDQESIDQKSIDLEPINQESILRDREKDVEVYGEPLENAFARMSPSRVAGLVKWRQTGLMLPYGDSALPYVYLNPMFFCGRPESFTHEPLSEWPMNEILDYTPYAAEGDVYGKMATYVREMLVKFQLRLKKNRIVVKLSNAGTVKMSGHFIKCFDKEQKFDRIEAGHLFDMNAPLCFLSFSPLLRHHEENPSATLLLMARGSFTKSDHPRVKELIADEKDKLFRPVSESLDSIAPPVQTTENKYSAACMHRHFALQVFDREWDMFSDRWLADTSHFNYEILEAADVKHSIFRTGWLGLQFKRKNTVKPRWQNRLMPRTGKILTEEDASNLRRWMSWSTIKPERWLEWKKVQDISWYRWSKYCEHLPATGARDYTVMELEHMYGFLAKEAVFLNIEEEYENCACGSMKRRNKCEHEHRQESALPTDIPNEQEAEDDSWMQMDSAEDSAAGGKSKQKKKKKQKKKQKKKAGKK